jgi:outer membrane protein TolC
MPGPGLPRPLRSSLLCTALLAGCESYDPAPVDLQAHLAEFAARLPDGASVQAFLAELAPRYAPAAAFDPNDGIDAGEGRLLALLFQPELRLARQRAGIAAASAATAGTLPDPELGFDVAKILESVAHPWIVAGSIGFTLPLTGRLGLEQQLAAAGQRGALVEVRLAEAEALLAVDRAFADWSATCLEEQLLAKLVEDLRGMEVLGEKLRAAGEIRAVDARPLALERLQKEAALQQLRSARSAAELRLRRQLGLHPAAPVRFVPALDPKLRVAAAEERRQQALANGPRLARREAEHERAERDLELAVSKQWPDMILAPGREEEDAQPRATLGFRIPLPLWNGNRREIAEARARRRLAAEELRVAAELVLQDLAVAELSLEASRARRQALEAGLVPMVDQQFADCVRLAELGNLDTLLLLDGLLRAHAAKVEVVQARLTEAYAIAQLDSFCWPEPTPPATKDAPR